MMQSYILVRPQSGATIFGYPQCICLCINDDDDGDGVNLLQLKLQYKRVYNGDERIGLLIYVQLCKRRRYEYGMMRRYFLGSRLVFELVLDIIRLCASYIAMH